MSSMTDLHNSEATDVSDLLPLSPFNSLRYHFGMLLGVDDFETEQAYHRAKMRLHNAWLHREGVVWGFGVEVKADRGEIRVKAGLALDAAGHELYLQDDHCINVGEWFEKHREDSGFNLDRDGFDVHVVICFRACLNRQVPALMEPCSNGGSSTAYSRVSETVKIDLLPGRAPERVYPYHRLRLMFGLVEPTTLDKARLDELLSGERTVGEFALRREASTGDAATETVTEVVANATEDQELLEAVRRDQAVLEKMEAIEALPVADQAAARLKAFHEFAALDEIDMRPATSEDGARTLLFPGREDDCLVLADITELKLTTNDNRTVLSGGIVDTSVRPSHVATTTIQDLLCGRLLTQPKPDVPDTGPRIDPASVTLLTPKAIMFRVDKDLLDASIKPAGFSVTWLDPEQGWQRANIGNAQYGGFETQTVVLDLDRAVSGRLRLIVFGSGPTPVLGADLVPLAGVIGGPPGLPHEGHDFVFMKELVAVEAESDEGSEVTDETEIELEERRPEAGPEPGGDLSTGEDLQRSVPKRRTRRK